MVEADRDSIQAKAARLAWAQTTVYQRVGGYAATDCLGRLKVEGDIIKTIPQNHTPTIPRSSAKGKFDSAHGQVRKGAVLCLRGVQAGRLEQPSVR